MPIYDFKCPSCEKKLNDCYLKNREEIVKCTRCRTEMKRLFPNRVSGYCFPQEGIYLEHVSAKGETFHSTREMRDYAKKHDLELGALG